ncbi:MAG: arylsulfatase [Verrucomicrobia bacterium]|nr:arylsulfatase [Verrucomicrobiota bacterium]
MKHSLLFLFAWLASLSFCSARPPNILFILADDIGYGDIGCYGQTKIKTPNVDRLAAEGMRFTAAYAGSTVCAPSRCTLMTGLHTGHAVVRGNAQVPLRPQDTTVAEMLKTAGYKTALVGKWGLGDEGSTGVPNKKGFDEFVGYLNQVHAHNYFPEFIWRQERQFMLDGNLKGGKREWSPDWFIRAGTNFIRDAYPGPFFLYFASIIPHANNERQRSEGLGMEIADDAPYSKEEWPGPERRKAAMITRLDTDVGKLIARLKEYKMTNTLVIFTSDNGPHKEGGNDPEFFKSSGPFRGIKRDLTEGGIRVPFIAWWPGRIAPGTTSDLPVAFWDFPATAAELAGAKAPVGDGLSIVPTLLGEAAKQKRHDFLYWEFHERGFQQAVRMGDWKGIRPLGKPIELYNLRLDPGEAQNVADANAAVVQQIEAYLKTARTDDPQWPITKEGAAKKAAKKKQ